MTLSIIAELEEAVEYWRQRAEKAEQALVDLAGPQADWNRAVRPLTLCETRIMRLLAGREMTGRALCSAMRRSYPRISDNSVKCQLSRIRKKLPADMAPARGTSRGYGSENMYRVENREALRAFLNLKSRSSVMGRMAA